MRSKNSKPRTFVNPHPESLVMSKKHKTPPRNKNGQFRKRKK